MAPRLRRTAQDSRVREDVRCAMTEVIVETVVNQAIASAQRRLDDGDCDWPASRAVLEMILFGLEVRALGHPDLRRLRRFIAEHAESWKASQESKNESCLSG
jgi:hypothetical protein